MEEEIYGDGPSLIITAGLQMAPNVFDCLDCFFLSVINISYVHYFFQTLITSILVLDSFSFDQS